MIAVYWQPKGGTRTKIDIISCTWSGTENQASRTLEFTVPWNPYDKGFVNAKLALGDRIFLYNNKKLLFAGVLTNREKTAAIGSASYTALDYLHYLLRSTVTRVFYNVTPKMITTSLCKEVGVKTDKLQDPKIYIEKAIYSEKSMYDIIIAAYRKAYKANGKKYMATMTGSKLNIIEKGVDSGVILDQTIDITDASYHDTTDNMVNYVKIYKNYYKQGEVKNDKNIEKYGRYMQAYTMKDDEDATRAANALMVGITKEASVGALGNVACVAGRSLKIRDKATGIVGKFYIASDTHTFANGIHTMSLELNYSNKMEKGATEEKDK